MLSRKHTIALAAVVMLGIGGCTATTGGKKAVPVTPPVQVSRLRPEETGQATAATTRPQTVRLVNLTPPNPPVQSPPPAPPTPKPAEERKPQTRSAATVAAPATQIKPAEPPRVETKPAPPTVRPKPAPTTRPKPQTKPPPKAESKPSPKAQSKPAPKIESRPAAPARPGPPSERAETRAQPKIEQPTLLTDLLPPQRRPESQPLKAASTPIKPEPEDLPASLPSLDLLPPPIIQGEEPQSQPAQEARTSGPAPEEATSEPSQTAPPPEPGQTQASPPGKPLLVDISLQAKPRRKPTSRPGGNEAIATAVIQVNNSFITIGDLLTAAHSRLMQLPDPMSEENFRNQAGRILAEEAQNLVGETVVMAEADKRLTDEQKKQIDEEMDKAQRELIAESGGSKHATEQLLLDQNTTLEAILKDHRRRVTVKLYLGDRFMPAIAVNRKSLWTYYRTHLEEFSSPKQVQMQIIAAPYQAFADDPLGDLPPPELQAVKDKAREWIDKAAAEVAAGKDFADVARKRSRGLRAADGGLWPLMPAGSFREGKVEEEAFRLQQGLVSSPVATETGFYLVKAAKVAPGSVVPFEDAQEKIEDNLRHDQYLKLRADYFSRLLQGAAVVQDDKFLQQALDRAVELYWLGPAAE